MPHPDTHTARTHTAHYRRTTDQEVERKEDTADLPRLHHSRRFPHFPPKCPRPPKPYRLQRLHRRRPKTRLPHGRRRRRRHPRRPDP